MSVAAFRRQYGFEGEAPAVSRQATRTHLCELFRALGYQRGAEIGVWKGAFSEVICQHVPGVALTCVDGWAPYPDYLERKNDAARLKAAYRDATRRLAPYAVTFATQPSAIAVRGVPDRSLDFVYIDADHRYDAALEDLTLWAPKVRAGGIVSGHDYSTRPDRHIDVERAVNDYTRAHSIESWCVLAGDAAPSFFWVAA